MSIRGEIDALAARYELPNEAADALQDLVGLVDWQQPNYVPTAETRRSLQVRKKKEPRRLALSILEESLAGLELEQVRTARRLVDVGTGAGFPGLVLAIAIPQARVILIEKRGAACRFLRRASEELGRDNVDVVEARAQQWSEGRGVCDVATVRNVGRVDKAVRLCGPLVATGGVGVLWLKRRPNSGLETIAAEAAAEAGLQLVRVQRAECRHEGGVDVRHLCMYEKTDPGRESPSNPEVGPVTRISHAPSVQPTVAVRVP